MKPNLHDMNGVFYELEDSFANLQASRTKRERDVVPDFLNIRIVLSPSREDRFLRYFCPLADTKTH